VNPLRIVAHGTPASQGSKQGFIRGKKVVLVEMDTELPAWRQAIQAAAKLAAGPDFQPIDEPVKITGEIRIRKPRTTKFHNHPAGPKDLDKMQRAIGDALESAGILTNDARIVHWDIRKVWATDVPGLDITITEAK
jgi:crossover junction endodeoxyribonuclease RusA